MLRALTTQLIHDFKASWQKATFLGILLLVGLYFWIPPLVRAVFGNTSETTAESATPEQTVPQPIEAETSFGAGQTATVSSSGATDDWQSAHKLLQSDPLVRSVEVAAIQGDPFRINHDQFPPPLLDLDVFEKDPEPDETTTAQSSPPKTLEGFVLKSTLIGKRRRAAFINNKLYYKGSEVRGNGQSYQLTAIYRRKVILKQGSQEYELKINDQSRKN